MRNIEIDLAQPFEKVLATVLSLPAGRSNAVTDRLSNEAEIEKVIRGLYEAANGRHVETNIGLIMIAPPAYAFLKAKPFKVTTQTDLLIEAATRLIAGPAMTDERRVAAGRANRPRAAHRYGAATRPKQLSLTTDRHALRRFNQPEFPSKLTKPQSYD
jgi:hypothetical protein